MRRVPQDFQPIDGALRAELPIDDDWRKNCRRRLREMGHKQDELAEYVGCSQSAISQAFSFKRKQKTFEYAHHVCMALGVELSIEARIRLVAVKGIQVNAEALSNFISGLELQYGIPKIKPP